jgi:hypothetical protein
MDKEFDNELANLWKPFGRGIYRKGALSSKGALREYRNLQNVGQMSDPGASAIDP